MKMMEVLDDEEVLQLEGKIERVPQLKERLFQDFDFYLMCIKGINEVLPKLKAYIKKEIDY